MEFPCEHSKYAWIACALDSEGTLYLTASLRIRFQVYNNNLAYLNAVTEDIGCGSKQTRIYKFHNKKGTSFSDKERYIYSLCSHSVLRKLLPKILPFLIIKHHRCELMIEALNLKNENGSRKPSPRLIEIYHEQGLKHGRPVVSFRKDTRDRKGRKVKRAKKIPVLVTN